MNHEWEYSNKFKDRWYFYDCKNCNLIKAVWATNDSKVFYFTQDPYESYTNVSCETIRMENALG